MLSIYDKETARTALGQPLDPILKEIIEARISNADTHGLSDQTHILFIQPDDLEQTIVDEVGWSPLVHPIDGTRFGTPEFQPYWSLLQDLGSYWEILHCVGSAFCFIILIQDHDDSELALLCRKHKDA